MQIVNSFARFHYSILDTLEAGIMLSGQEVKSVKNGQMNLKASYISIKNREAWLINAHISPYQQKNTASAPFNPVRARKLLLTKKEILSLEAKIASENLTIIPLKVYTKHALVKIEIGLARGKKLYDKRSILKKREMDRKIRSVLRFKR